MAAAARKSLGLGSRVHKVVDAPLQSKAVEFFREVCRCLPSIVTEYKLDELTSVGELRGNIAKLFRQNEGVNTPEVIDLLIYKGREELEMILMHHKQRHHLVDRYVCNPALEKFEKPSNLSPFLEAFYKSN
jgi:NADH dehydrogenase (ubiquinone) 1 alpha subcomplex subunit 6